jgi:hypothetical protein
MNMTNEDNIDPLLDIENADFLELSASQEEILVKSHFPRSDNEFIGSLFYNVCYMYHVYIVYSN